MPNELLLINNTILNNRCVKRKISGEIRIIDVSQAVEHDHPSALEFLRKDCSNITGKFYKIAVHRFFQSNCHDHWCRIFSQITVSSFFPLISKWKIGGYRPSRFYAIFFRFLQEVWSTSNVRKSSVQFCDWQINNRREYRTLPEHSRRNRFAE